MAQLEGKTAVLTGGTRGFGLALARRLAGEGAAVVVGSRSPESVEKAVATLRADGGEASGLPCDVACLPDVIALARHAVETFGSFDIWVNGAGLSAPYGPTAAISPEWFEKVTNTNVLGTYYGTRVALGHMLPRGSGKIINLVGRGEKGPSPNQSAYAASKAWIRNFTLSVAKEYADSGVGVFTYNPGLMPTDFLTHVEAVEGYGERMGALKTVVRMWGSTPEEATDKALWLASPATDGKTGLTPRQLTFWKLLGGALREGVSRLFGLKRAEMPLEVIPIPADLPEPLDAARSS